MQSCALATDLIYIQNISCRYVIFNQFLQGCPILNFWLDLGSVSISKQFCLLSYFMAVPKFKSIVPVIEASFILQTVTLNFSLELKTFMGRSTAR